ncbi:MAG TPA: PVC-type heme-binding CxxCH protein [Planctomycetota bacterium]|nr:PVC-type heme-binding CxxCH protein [Planctomycetota bacterium]
MRTRPGDAAPDGLPAALLVLLLTPFAPVSLRAGEEAVDPAALAKELPGIPPREPKDALESFRLKDGFQIELVAAEPDVVDPVAMVFDEEGRMLVVEMRDYPFEPGKGQSPEQDARAKAGRVRLLDDTDGDGRADRSIVYADGLSWPTGIVASRGGVFVTSAPDILYLRDEDGDGVADRREVVYTGFGKENVQGLLNSLRPGLDNRVHGASGHNGGEVRAAGGPGGGFSPRGRDFRFLPGAPGARGAIEATSGGGQFGLSFDDWGNRFVSSNSSHIRLVALEVRHAGRNPFFIPPPLVIDIPEDGGAAPVFRSSAPEPWRLVRTRWRAASAERSRFAATELVPAGYFTSASGIFIYRGGAFPPEYRGNAFIGDVGGNLVHRKVLQARGTVFVARRAPDEARSEFLTSTDNWFRPVGFAEGPDGALYVLDMYRETIEHPDSIPDSIKGHLDLKSGDDRGRIYRIFPRGFAGHPRPRLRSATVPDLAGCLDNESSWWRETGQRLVVERLGPGNGEGRAAGGEEEEILRSIAREGPRPLARLHALHALDGMGRLRALDVERALSDHHPGVREAAARLGGEVLARGRDPVLLAGLRRLAADPEVRVRKAAALAVGGLEGSDVVSLLADIARRDVEDPWMRASILCALPAHAAPLLEALIVPPSLDDSSSGRALLVDLAQVVGAMNDPPRTARALAAVAAAAAAGREAASLVLLGLGEGLRRTGTSLSLLVEAPPEDLALSVRALGSLFERAASRAADPLLPEPLRIESIRLLALARSSLALEALPPLLAPHERAPVQLAALRALAALPGRGAAEVLVGRWKSFSPSLLREAVETMFQRAERLPVLLDGIEAGAIPPADLEAERRRRLVENADAAVRDRARSLLGGQVANDRRAVIAEHLGALELEGDAARGRSVFLKACAACHRLGGEGLAVAPDFRTVKERTPESLLVHTLDPNREVLPGYVSYSLLTRDGRVLTGIIAGETSASVTLRRAEGVEETVLRSEIESLESTGLSLMPEGLEKDLTLQDLSDLIERIRTSQ